MTGRRESAPMFHQPKPLASAIRALIAGGLVFGGQSPTRADSPLPVPTNVNALATAGQASATVNGTAMTINQLTNKATLDWKSFNIDKGYSVEFKQPSSTSVALNNIHQQDASKILGSLTANGQVYLINQNGFLFGKDSQVNVNALVASTLNISQADFDAGITKVFDLNKNRNDYATTAAALKGNGEIFLKNNQGQYVLDEAGNKVKIQIYVDRGAKIKTHGDGGRVILAAPSITNAGTIETPDGQTILAASSDRVYLQEVSDDPDLRGLLVEVGTGGDANNVGKIIAERGNASLVGFAVNQEGIVSATTSVKLNGSVRLMAREGIQAPTSVNGKLVGRSTKRASALDDGLGTRATVNLAAGSETRVDLDSDKTATAIDAQAQSPSKIAISGHRVNLRSGGKVVAKSGDISIQALDNPGNPTQKGDARIVLEAGSTLDVSGVDDVALAAERNVVEVELRKNELRDAPLQRDGVLFTKKVKVDLRDANLTYDDDGKLATATIPVADIKGAVDRIARNIDERSTSGGRIELKSSGDVITQAGATIDVSGGSVTYKGGWIETTKVGAGTQVVDIADANPDGQYDRLFNSAHYSAAYTEGKAGGRLQISAYEALIEGHLLGQTVNGVYQRLPNQWSPGAELIIDLINGNTQGKQDIRFTHLAELHAIGPNDPIPRKANGSPEPMALILNTEMLRASGFRTLNLATNGKVTFVEGSRLDLPAGGRLSIAGRDFDVFGSIVAPSGHVTLTPAQIDGILLPSGITLGSSALIDVSGAWVNDALDLRQGKALKALAIDGGTVSLRTEQRDLDLTAGSRILADGGAWMQGNARLKDGKGGEIHLRASRAVAGTPIANVRLNGQLSARALAQNGRLAVETSEIVIGSAADLTPHHDGTVTLRLSPTFFSDGGFADYQLTSNLYGVTVADGVNIDLRQRNYQTNSLAANTASGARLAGISSVTTLPVHLIKPVNLTLSFIERNERKSDERLYIGNGARIVTDPGGSISLNASTAIIVNGTLSTPAGSLALNIVNPPLAVGFFDRQGIWLGANSRLLAKGTFIQQPNAHGLTLGDVLDGGSVTLKANRGYIVTEAGSLIDVSGTAKSLDLYADVGGRLKMVKRSVASDGGHINLTSGEGMLIDGQLKANAGGAQAAGGSLTVALQRGLRDKPEFPIPGQLFPDDGGNANRPYRIEISSDSASVIPGDLDLGGAVNPATFGGRALFKAPALNAAGFDSLAFASDTARVGGQLNSAVLFKGDVALEAARSIVVDTPSIQSDGGNIQLSAAYVALGSSSSRLNQSLAPAATAGSGQFTVNAKGIELIGGLAFGGVDTVNLNSTGDVRMRGLLSSNDKNWLGELKLAGDLNVRAAQLYPATLTQYTINLIGNRTATFINQAGASRSPVLSAGGQLTVNAANIDQRGTLKAPFGQLTLNASERVQLGNGSLTSVSGEGAVVPFGRGSGGVDWLYPLNDAQTSNILVETPPAKNLQLTGNIVDLQAGARIDLSGGGDLYAYEFVPGPGGSRDVLGPGSSSFAVLPGFNNLMTPFDPLEMQGAGIDIGDSVYLNAGAGLAAGWYTLLPAHYALLPGAYLVTPKAGTQDLVYNATELSGSTLVAGRYGVQSAGSQESRTQGFVVEPGRIARTRSQYFDFSANDFFANKAEQAGVSAPQLPRDAGSLVLSAQNSLNLSAQLLAQPALNGLGGQVDITGNKLAVVAQRSDLNNLANGVVGLLADDINQFNAPSLLLGGKRSKESGGQRIRVSASTVDVGTGVHLLGNELLIAARDKVDVATGATLESRGQSAATDALLVDNVGGGSDGALLRVSAGKQVDVRRTGAIAGQTGELSISNGATIRSQGSVLMDATRNTVFDGTLAMSGGSLALNASRISIGEVPENATGLVLKNADFNLDELRLNSRSDFDIYGTVNFNANRLSISAANLNGFDNLNKTATIRADVIELSNTGASGARNGNGQGILSVEAKQLHLGSGQYAIQGFDQVNFTLSESLIGSGRTVDAASGKGRTALPGTLRVVGDLAIDAGMISGGAGATTTVDARGFDIDLAASAARPQNGVAGLGASWSMLGDRIAGDGRFVLPSGVLNLQTGNGGIALGSSTSIDVSGRAMAFDNVVKASAGGSLNLVADGGDIGLAAGSRVDLGGARLDGQLLSAAGRLSVQARQGAFDWSGAVDASSTGGDLTIDAHTLGDFSTLAANIAASSFDGSLALRQRSGDVDVGQSDSLVGRTIALEADQGHINIAGRLDVSGDKAGAIDVYGRNGVTLASSGRLLAKSTGNGREGGRVVIDTVHRDGNGSGLLNLSAAGGVIDVSGGEGGEVHLRTGRDAQHQVNVSAINSMLVGAAPQKLNLEASRVYGNQTLINAGQIALWKADTDTFMANRPTLQGSSAAAVTLLPGLDIRSNGNLTLASGWDFMAGAWSVADQAWQSEWRYTDGQGQRVLPGFLSLTAAGDLNINASLSDGFAKAPLIGQALLDEPDNPLFAEDYLSKNLIQPGLSWRFSLKAGQDVNLAARDSAGEQVTVRTGTGDIAIEAGRDLTFKTVNGQPKAAAAVYTLGTTARYTRTQLLNGEIPGIPAQQPNESLSNYLARLGKAQLDQLLRYGLLDELSIALGSELFAEFPIDGGDIRLQAGRNISGIQTGQSIGDWLVRGGGIDSPTAWGINLSGDRALDAVEADDDGKMVFPTGNRFFNLNVGALAGGAVDVVAGGHIQNLSVMIPTTGKPLGQLNEANQWTVRDTAVNGGGSLSLRTGGDIVGGEFYVGDGHARLDAGGSIRQGAISGSTRSVGAIVNLGSAAFDLTARQDITLAAALSPTVLGQSKPGNPSTNVDTRFFSYDADSAVNLLSVAGNVVLDNDYEAIKTLKGLPVNAGTGFEYFVYPGTLRGVALSGDLRLNQSFTLFPSAKGELQLLAAGQIGSDTAAGLAKTLRVNMSDTDPTLLPGIANPARALEGSFTSGILLTRELLDPQSPKPATIHAPIPVHTGHAAIPLVMAKSGDIAFAAGLEATFYMPQAARFIAGNDIVNLSISGQNLTANDSTRIEAGRDIRFDTVLDGDGNVVLTRNNPQFFRLAGPGQLQVLAGRTLSLGSSGGIETVGNLLNSALSLQGASVNVLAGIAGNIDLAGFVEQYRGRYPQELADLAGLTPQQLKNHVGDVLTVLFKELAESAKAAARAPESERKALYQRGFDAIAHLFPGDDYQGDISLVFSSIKTLAGGDINLAAPGGKLDVGLTGKKAAGELGIVVQQDGDLNAFTRGNINVNQSRVFTLGGGDIMAWSSKGDIDAGKGAKSALSAPKPITTIDGNGNIVTVFPPIISGSGIQAIGGGDVTLAAPEGVVDAGEAGISGGNITIAATAVIGASNIQASGSSVGVPTAVAPPSTPTGAEGAAASAARQADQNNAQGSQNQDKADDGKKNKSSVAMITTDVVGFGDCSVSDVREGKQGCG